MTKELMRRSVPLVEQPKQKKETLLQHLKNNAVSITNSTTALDIHDAISDRNPRGIKFVHQNDLDNNVEKPEWCLAIIHADGSVDVETETKLESYSTSFKAAQFIHEQLIQHQNQKNQLSDKDLLNKFNQVTENISSKDEKENTIEY